MKALVDNFLRGPPLALPLEQLLTTLFDRLHENVKSEEFFEDHDDDVDDCSEVPMEIVDDAIERDD